MTQRLLVDLGLIESDSITRTPTTQSSHIALKMHWKMKDQAIAFRHLL